MRRVHIIGRKNHGKTLLVVELVREFSARGLKVATIKHTHHRHELDTPGKDSHRHRQAGAVAVGILSQGMSAVFVPSVQDTTGRDRYAPFEAMLAGADLIVVEGDSQTTAPKIEVWRAELGIAPLTAADPSIRALVTDDRWEPGTPAILARSDVPGLANWIHEHIMIA